MRRADFRLLLAAFAVVVIVGCTGVDEDEEFFGRLSPPEGQNLRYISGSEPLSMDPQIGTGQPESRIYSAIYDSLTEHHPQTNQPLPSIAQSWEANEDNTEFVFHIRESARWSDGDPIRAEDFVSSWRRALSPALAAPNAYMAYHIRYAPEYNAGAVFVWDPETGRYLLDDDPADGAEQAGADPSAVTEQGEPELTEFRSYIVGPTRITLPGDEASREALLAEDPGLRDRVEGLEFVPVGGEHIGVEAVDPLTLRVTLNQPVPFFPGLTTHQFLRPVPEQAIAAHGDNAWTRPENIVTSGAYHLTLHQPYDKIVVTKSDTFWDRETARLETITFYSLEDATTMMNLYKAGEVDALYNHTVPIAWLDTIRPLADYMDAPENAIEYYIFNTTEPPFDDVRVRKAFNAAIDKDALVQFKGTGKPLTAFTPESLYPGYVQPDGDAFDVERARELLAEAGFADGDGDFDPDSFPGDALEILYNTNENNRQMAEFVQAQWRQNLGVTIGLRNMEWQAYLEDTRTLDFQGVARRGWVGDYMDPYTFLELFATPTGNNGSGWFSEEFVTRLENANLSQDPQDRYALLAEAETMILEVQPVIPLYTSSTSWVKKPYVKGMYPNPGTQFSWKWVYIEHDPELWDTGTPSLVPDGRYTEPQG